MKLVISIALILGLCFIGIWQWQKKADADREARAMEYRREVEKKEAEEKQRTAMTTFANGMHQHYAARIKAIEQEVEGFRKDSARLTEIVSGIMVEKDGAVKDLRYDEKILLILKHVEVNTLAQKYLGSDFSGITAEFAARARDAHDAEEKYADAVNVVESVYAENMKRAGAWAKMSAQQRDEEVSRLSRELKRLETKREREQKEIKTISKLLIKGDEHTEQEREAQKRVAVNKLRDTENEIFKKRHQIDYLRNPNNMRRVESDAVSQTQSRQREASSQRQQAMWDIDRRLKPKKALTDVVSDFESKTIAKLRKVLTDKISDGEKEARGFKDKIMLVEEFLLAVPVSDMQELMRRKAKLEK